MNETNVLMTQCTPAMILSTLLDKLPELTPETHKAAVYVIENPNDVGVSSIRELAAAAGVKPNSLVRMASACGFTAYDEFRLPFREQLRRGDVSFPDRARWLQSLSADDQHGTLYTDMATSAVSNLENTFAATSAEQLRDAARTIVCARRTFVLGVGINHTLARNFAYLADMAVSNVLAIPREGNLAVDDIARATPGDVLVAMTFKPYRSEVVEAVRIAREQGVTVVSLSDSRAAPIMIDSEHRFLVQTNTPQFFTSTFATSALLETLMAFVAAEAGPEVVANIERFHQRRLELGIYVNDDDGTTVE